MLQEAVPTLDDAWLEGKEGEHLIELVVPVKRNFATEAKKSNYRFDINEVTWRSKAKDSGSSVRRQCSPGGEWMYLKLYVRQEEQDTILARNFSMWHQSILGIHNVEEMHFVRYLDPDDHIRFRWKAIPDILWGDFFQEVCRWCKQLLQHGMCSRFAFDTYDREIERYGGYEGIGLAERLFSIDTNFVLKLLRFTEISRARGDLEYAKLDIAVASCDSILTASGLTPMDRLRWGCFIDSYDSRRR